MKNTSKHKLRHRTGISGSGLRLIARLEREGARSIRRQFSSYSRPIGGNVDRRSVLTLEGANHES